MKRLMATACLLWMCSCGGVPQGVVDMWDDAVEDGIIDGQEQRMLSRTLHAPPPPSTDWFNLILDVGLGLLGVGGTVTTSVFATNKIRDRRRLQRGEPVSKAKKETA